jgi:nitrilase
MPLARYTFHGQQEQIHIAQWHTVKTMHQIASRNYAFEGGAVWLLLLELYFTKMT